MHLLRLHASILRATPAWPASSTLLPFRLAPSRHFSLTTRIRQLNRSFNFHFVRPGTKAVVPRPKAVTRNPFNGARRSYASDAQTSFFPPVSSKAVAYWLLGSAASVFGIVVFGGLTRLTESG
jgi:hypothetical protein